MSIAIRDPLLKMYIHQPLVTILLNCPDDSSDNASDTFPTSKSHGNCGKFLGKCYDPDPGLLTPKEAIEMLILVGGWTNPSETILVSQNGFIFPKSRAEMKKMVETTNPFLVDAKKSSGVATLTLKNHETWIAGTCSHPMNFFNMDKLLSYYQPFLQPQPSKKQQATTPLKINMEHNHGGLDDNFPFFSWVICRFQPLIFQGVRFLSRFIPQQTGWKNNNIRPLNPQLGHSWAKMQHIAWYLDTLFTPIQEETTIW